MSLIENTTEQPKLLVDPNAIDRRSGKPKELSRKAKAGIRMVLQGEVKHHKDAAAAVGLHVGHFSELIHSPAGQAFIARERSKTITVGSLRAARRMIELVDAASEHVSLDASKTVLAIEGIAPPQSGGVNININNNIACGYVVKLREPGESSVNAASTLIEG